ncbi:complement C1q-like protein 3 isoform X1 [Mytilus californianus]|uniref:complement C1q-like protein 3 isoform X1 n=1 Tax=Mytilus californianus TaxID=6549 RepID=UPI002245CB7B|nr:complement C1q-like protein 3 isoform X1 [Mytilus californianus]
MKMMITFGYVFFQLMIMATADCSPKLDNAVVEDLLTMLVNYKGPDFRNTRKWRDIPAFTASLLNEKNINAKEIVKFDKVWTNNGNHYDPNTGIFIAPREGLYHVSTTVMSVSGKTVYAHIWQNETRTVGLFPGTGYSEATANIVLQLSKGDKVTVRGSGNHPYLYSSSNHYSMFSAYLIA